MFAWLYFKMAKHCPSYVQGTSESNMYFRERSGRVLDYRPRGCGYEPQRRHCVVSLCKNINPSLVLVQSRKTRPCITERLLMEGEESNQTNKTKYVSVSKNVYSRFLFICLKFLFQTSLSRSFLLLCWKYTSQKF